MKISLFVTDTAMQFNLTPETEHEKNFMKLLEKYNGEVKINSGIEVIETRGDYLRNAANPKAITFTVHQGTCMCEKAFENPTSLWRLW